ncbi:hypothetical protein BpHYR1_049598, partial [Brachionus plicatilis]
QAVLFEQLGILFATSSNSVLELLILLPQPLAILVLSSESSFQMGMCQLQCIPALSDSIFSFKSDKCKSEFLHLAK